MEQISNLLNLPNFAMPSFGFNSILDIALIAFVSYKLLGWIRQTRAWAVFKGIITLAIVYFLSYLLGMHTTVWLIEQTVTWAVIALMIIFQPELRRVLERLGKGRFIPLINTLNEDKEATSTKTIEEILKSASTMSKAKTGALIVIEQDVPLGDIASTGVIVDALVSSPLLLNIFKNNTPLHDGAVLIQGNRAKAASCILPLSESEMATEVGTRHRAALGVSETSDAYVLIVSEETGAISIAKDGVLHQDLTEAQAKNMLLSNIRPKKKPRRKKGQEGGGGSSG